MKTATSLRLKLFFGCLLLLVAAQAFNGALSLTSLEKLYTNSMVSSFEAVGGDFLHKLQAAVRFGKPLDKFFGIEKAMDEVSQDIPELNAVRIALPDGAIVQHSHQEPTGTLEDLLQTPLNKLLAGKKTSAAKMIQTGQQRHLLFTLYTPGGEIAGFVVFSFPEVLIQQRVMAVLQQNLQVLALVTACAALFLFLGLRFFVGFEKGMQKRRLYAVLLLAVGGAQLAYAFYNIDMFHERYVEMTSSKTEKLTRLVRRDVEYLLDKGLSINRLVKIEKHFMDIIHQTPEVELIEIRTNAGVPVNRATAEGPVSKEDLAAEADHPRPVQDSFYDIVLPLKYTTDMGLVGDAGVLHVGLSREKIQATVREIFLDSLTVTVISLLFVVELLIFFMLTLRKSFEAKPKPAELSSSKAPPKSVPGEAAFMLGRPAAFAFVFMWALPASFIPLYMQTLYSPMLGFSKDLVLGLPISVEMFCALVAALISGVVTDRRGWHLPFIAGAALCAAGGLLSASASNGQAFIISRGVTGFGYGLSWMAIQGFIFQYSTPDTRARGIANLVAGIVSGQICGTAVGAMLAERLGYAPVFVGSAMLAVLPVVFVLSFMRPYMHKVVEAVKKERVRLADIRSLVFNRNYFAILFFSLVPFALCQVGLLFYAAPIYLNELGMNQSNIGRVLMIYGLSVIYVAPWISRFVDRSRYKKRYIVLGGIVGGLGLMSLYFYSGFLAVMLAVFLMGLSGSLVGSSQSAFALKLAVIQRVGVGKAMSVQRAADKLGQMLGPLVLGAMIASVGISNGMAIVGLVFFVATLVFLLIASEDNSPSV